jgi:hypothetical protein
LATPAEIPILQSLADLRELVFQCLEISGAKTVVEVGAETGALTAFLAEWAEVRSAHVYSIEPQPTQSLRDIVEPSAAVELVVGRSPGCLADLEAADAYLLDGDHNYYTVSTELSAIASMASRPADCRSCCSTMSTLGLDHPVAGLKPLVAERDQTIATILAARSRRAKTLLRALKRRL